MAIPENYIDKITKDGDSRIISPSADNVRVDNENFEGADLDEVLDEVAQAIEDAGGGGYEPPVGGIPKTDLASDVQASLGKADTALQSYTETDPTVPSWAKQPSKPGYNVAEIIYSSGRMLSSKLDEMDAGIAAASDVDSEMSDSSTKAVQNKVIKGYVDDGLSDKVDKVTGKGLSTNDYTTAEKSKLAGIAAGAEVNVNADWNASSGDAAILNKPTLSTVATSGSYNDLTGKPTIKDVWVTTPSTVDGTFTIHVGEDEYTINLNHDHTQYLKYQLCADEAAYNAIANKDSGTLYLIPES